MAEFIDRQKVLDLTKTFALDIDWVEDPMYLEFSYVATNVIKNIPAADVRPVVKAQWVYTDMSRLVCSNCGNPVAFALKDDGWHHGDYCPNCGARMEES